MTKALLRTLVAAIALLVGSQIAYGMPFSELASVAPVTVGLTESGTLLLVGVGMLLFARTAKRRSGAAEPSQHF